MSAFFPILAFALCVLALWGGRKLALRLGYADVPGGRKKHDVPVPPIGGLVVLPGFMLVAIAAGYGDFLTWSLIFGLTGLLLMGAIDDARPLRPLIKFAFMVWTACFVVIFGETQIGQLGNLFGFGMVELGFLSKGFTIMSLVLLMNSINMMDGVDGLAGGFCALMTFWLMLACAGAGQWVAFGALAILLGCLLAFLLFNMRAPWRKSASVFMGDAGALCLGLLLGWFAIHLSIGRDAPLAPITIVWIIAVPVMDAFGLFIARSVRGLNPFLADRRHLHHHFIDSGCSPGMTVYLILSLVAAFALVGFMAQAQGVPAYVMFYVWMVIFLLHTLAILKPGGYDALVAKMKTRGE